MAKKQLEIPGTAPIAAIEEAAETYVETRDKRMALTTKEVEHRAKLVALMHEHKRLAYKYDGKTILLTVDEKVSVKTEKETKVKE